MRTSFLRLFFFVSLSSFAFFNLFSQSDFKPGYIITNSNDTIRGFIDYRGEIRNSKICSFKKGLESKEKDYKPFDIHAYRFTPEGKYYVSKIVENEEEGNQKIFVEYILNGIVDLYYYRDFDRKHYLLDKGNGSLIEMTNEELTKKIDNKTYKYNSRQYIGALKYSLADQPELFKKINNLGFSHNEFTDILKRYHDLSCEGEVCIVYEKSLPILTLAVSPFIMYMISSPAIYKREFFEDCNYQTSRGQGAGILLDFFSPQANERLFMRFGLAKSNANYFGNYEGKLAAGFEYYESGLDASYTTVQLGFGYIVPTGRLRPSAAFQVNFEGVNYSADISRFTHEYSRVDRVESDLNMIDIYRTWGLQTGVNYFFNDHFSVFLLLEANIPMVTKSRSHFRNTNLNFKTGLSYKL